GPPPLPVVAVPRTHPRPLPGLVRAAAAGLAAADAPGRLPPLRRTPARRTAVRGARVLPRRLAARGVHVRDGDATRRGALPRRPGGLPPSRRPRHLPDAPPPPVARPPAAVRACL